MRLLSAPLAASIFFTVAASHAAVTLQSSSIDTPGLPGFNTWTVTAISDDPITAIDFVGDGSNDPATGRGFFGSMNQLTAAGMPTPWQDFNVFLPQPDGPKQDSQFLVTQALVVVPAGLAEENANLLQGAWAWSTSPGMQIPFAQIVIPNTNTQGVSFRGAITALVDGAQTDFPVSGMIGGVSAPFPVITPVNLGEIEQATTIMANLVAAGGPIIWSGLTPTAGSPAMAATLTSSGAFSWNPAGSKRGPKGSGVTYSWTATATNAAAADTRVAITLSLIPEPTALVMFATMVTVACGGRLTRRRREHTRS